MGCGSSRIPACCGKNKDELQVDESSALPLPYDTSKDDGGVTEGVAGVLFGGGEARHEKEQPQDKEEPTKETPAAASEDSTPAAKSGSDSKDKVANEAGSESSSEQSDHDKDNDKSDGGFAVRIADKLGLMPTEEKEDETAATAAVDTDAGPTEETPAAAGEVATPAAKSDSDSSDSGSSSGRSEQDKDNDKNNRGFVGMIAETLGLMPSEEKEDKTAAPAPAPAPAADANANANAGATAY